MHPAGGVAGDDDVSASRDAADRYRPIRREPGEAGAGVQVPDAQGVVEGGRDRAASVGGEGDMRDRVRVSRQPAQQLTPRRVERGAGGQQCRPAGFAGGLAAQRVDTRVVSVRQMAEELTWKLAGGIRQHLRTEVERTRRQAQRLGVAGPGISTSTKIATSSNASSIGSNNSGALPPDSKSSRTTSCP